MKDRGRITFDGIGRQYILDKKAPVNIQGRWSSFCFAFDIKTEKREYYTEGKPFIGSLSSVRNISSFMSNNTDLPMVIRIGHYYFDNKPLIGRIVDINIWSRFLSSSELQGGFFNSSPQKS